MSSSRLLRGTLLLTAATFISKFLGMIYVFPFYALIDSKGAALYSYAYIPYSILISMATMGVPLAVSKFVSKYNAIGNYELGRRMYASGVLFMAVTGVIAFFLLYMIAPVIAPLIIGDNPHGNSYEDVTYVIRMVSVALIIVPIMSITRGFFQGYQEMEPTAVSQVVEQIVRIVFVLASAFIIIKVVDGEVTTAVGFATFAAFIGALGGLFTLLLYWRKYKDKIQTLAQSGVATTEISLADMYRELFRYAGPFVFVSLAIPLFQLVDQFTFNRAMISIGLQEIAEDAFSMLNFSSNKLVMIPVSLATAFALTLVPAITSSFTENNRALLHKQMSQTFQILMFFVLPAVFGLSALSYPAFAAFFGVEDALLLGGDILKEYAPVALLFSFFSVTAAILQGINQHKFAVIGLFIGLIVKIILNVPLIQAMATTGSIIATALGYGAAVAVNIWIIRKYTKFRFEVFIRRSLLIIIFTIIMIVLVKITEFLLSQFLPYELGRGQSSIVLLISIAIGAGTYLWLSYRSRLMHAILGDAVPFLNRAKGSAAKVEN